VARASGLPAATVVPGDNLRDSFTAGERPGGAARERPSPHPTVAATTPWRTIG